MITKEEMLAKIEKLDIPKLSDVGWEDKSDPDLIKRHFSNSISDLFNSLDGPKAVEELLKTYYCGFEHHRFYNDIIWKLCAIILPLSVTISAYTWQNSTDYKILLVGFGFAYMLYWIFFLIYLRIDWQIRKNRLYLRVLENLLGLCWFSFRRMESIKKPLIITIRSVWIGLLIIFPVSYAIACYIKFKI